MVLRCYTNVGSENPEELHALNGLYRLVHNACYLDLSGDSVRKIESFRTKAAMPRTQRHRPINVPLMSK